MRGIYKIWGLAHSLVFALKPQCILLFLYIIFMYTFIQGIIFHPQRAPGALRCNMGHLGVSALCHLWVGNRGTSIRRGK